MGPGDQVDKELQHNYVIKNVDKIKYCGDYARIANQHHWLSWIVSSDICHLHAHEGTKSGSNKPAKHATISATTAMAVDDRRREERIPHVHHDEDAGASDESSFDDGYNRRYRSPARHSRSCTRSRS